MAPKLYFNSLFAKIRYLDHNVGKTQVFVTPAARYMQG